jgi:hypothetical protein
MVSAQESMNNASVSGRVTDQTGAVVDGAQVTARQTDTNLTSTLLTDRDGRFRFPYLKVGQYEIKCKSRDSPSPRVRSRSRWAPLLNCLFRSSSRRSDTNVTVSAEAAVLEAARTQIAGTVSQTEVRALPLNGRNFLDLALLVPGVSPTNTASNQLFAETSAVPGQGISVGSQRNFSNNFIVDGLSANDDAAGLSGIFYGLDVVNEFQVVTSGGQAELGRALGGYINMVTKSGTNDLHGDLYGYFRNQRFNAANPLSNTKLPSTQAQYGASLGGPVPRPHLLLRQLRAAGAESERSHHHRARQRERDQRPACRHRLPRGADRHGPLSKPRPQYEFLAKLDHQFSANDQFSVRYSLYDVHSNNSRGAGALSAATASAGLDNTDQTVAVSNIATLSPRTVNETRAQFTNSNLLALPTDPSDPRSAFPASLPSARFSGSPTGRLNKLYEVADSISHHEGAHALRAGVDFLYNGSTITFPRSIRGSYTFSSLANFLQGTYNNSGFTQTFGNPVVSQPNPNVGFYAQDEWKISSRVTLNLGVRYDLQFLKTIATDTNNISPRAGFAWSPFQSRRTVVRGSFGLFYDRVPLRALANALLSSGNTTNFDASTQASVSLSPTQTGAPVFPNILTTVPSGVLISFTTMNPHMQNAYSEQGSLEIEQQLGRAQHLERGLPASARAPSHRFRQSERAHLHGVGQQQRMPPEPELREQQPVFLPGRLSL